MIVFDNDYDGESIVDMPRDIEEAFNSDFNSIILGIPVDEYNFMKGSFNVKIEWSASDE